jgi:hypothetical protein
MPAPLNLIYPAFARVQETGRRAEMTAQQLKQAEIQLMTALETQMAAVALKISFYREMLDANWEAQKEYQHAGDYLYHLLTR